MTDLPVYDRRRNDEIRAAVVRIKIERRGVSFSKEPIPEEAA